ncbi:radical SAM domain protein [Bacteriovorax sp. BSW11_IV]|uniref:B12-binding domain-containing radical SAM protein n=1 Tax=Bacteriovorax sp. BSW11_IV TaxID=1353529 RepID=UPI00038A3B10|nr:radical SAM protein [Bacteriovorax sp. BSW11_IV]EQC45893.1 radical SAM domain protein [Bacteriovorax sp. BSW11_IV]
MTAVTLISPNLVLQKNDIMTTGIVYMPVSLAYLAGELRTHNYQCNVIDSFGESPNQWREKGNFIYRGLTPQEVSSMVSRDSSLIAIYAMSLIAHDSIVEIIKELKNKFPEKKIAILENSQAVTAYAVRKVQKEFHDLGVDYIIAGEPEERVKLLLAYLENKIEVDLSKEDGFGIRLNGVDYFNRSSNKIKDLDTLSYAAWDLFPIQNYWNLRYAHGPQSSSKYLPILTSRGCPYACNFCVIPDTNDRKWRAKTPSAVTKEIQFYMKTFGVTEFHFEDVNPTVNNKRINEICDDIIQNKLNIKWKLCAGTKVETLRNTSTIEKMAQAGCNYISISPESGSPELMKLINKPFDISLAINLIRHMNKCKIYSQACFILGFPGETDADRVLTKKMLEDLTKNGLDETALFIVTPVPGSSIDNKFSGYKEYSELNFSPTWRDDYEKLSKFRISLYRTFMIHKLIYSPIKMAIQCIRFLRRRFNTKMEMVPYRALHTTLMLKGILGKKVTQ